MSVIGKNDQSGFTLIEILVVIAILGLIAGIAFPALERTVAQQQYSMAVRSVELALHEARASAVLKGRVTSFMLPRTSEGIAIRMTQEGIFFFSDGSANGGNITITAGRREAVIKVDPVTGLIGQNK